MIGQNGKNKMQKPYQVILFDSSITITDIENYVQKSHLIISLDYDSHKLLEEKSMTHDISDNFLTNDEIWELQKESNRLSNWYDEDIIHDLIKYDEINLGKLFYVEFHYFLVPYLKKIKEIIKIIKKYPECHFICSENFAMFIQTLTDSFDIIKVKKKESIFLYDNINYPIKIKNKIINLSIPKKYYKKIKNTFEMFSNLFFGINKISNSKNNILLVEFDTMKYEPIFSKMSRYPINFVCYGRRRPMIWNFKTISIIKNSGCFIVSEDNLIYEKSKKLIHDETIKIKHNLEILWNKDNFVSSYFSLNGYSFWETIKPMFVELCQKRIVEAIHEIELTKKLFEKLKFSSVVIWSENGFNEQIIIKISKKFKIPLMLLQHGLYYDTKKAYEFNKFAGVLPFDSDKILVWGDIMKKYTLECGIPSEKIEICGNPTYDKLFHEQLSSNQNINDYILVVTSSPQSNIISDLTINTRTKYENFIKTICTFAKNKNKNLIIKLNPFQEELNVYDIAKKIYPNVIVIKEGDIFSLIKKAELIIVTDMSTAILEAQMLQKPVFSVNVKGYEFGDSSIFHSDTCLVVELDALEKTLDGIMDNSELKNQMIKRGTEYIQKYLYNQGNSSEYILSFLAKI